MSKVCLISLGGTITGCSNNPVSTTTYQVPILSAQQLLDSIPALPGVLVDADNFMPIESSSLTPNLWQKLSKHVTEKLNMGYDGVVILHGTDTMEETAYYLNLTVNTSKPIVITGAMRPNTALSADGPLNLYQAIQVAASKSCHNLGVVTVMNAEIHKIASDEDFSKLTATQIRAKYKGKVDTLLAEIDTLKVANITVEGPNKTVTGGRYSNPLIKFGKTARIEMQDALGRANAVEAFGGCVNEYSDASLTSVEAMHVTEDFAPTRLIIGETFFISRETGKQVKVDIVFYQVLPDSIFNLTQDAEGDATVFDMNADLLTTEIKMDDDNGTVHGVFYSIIPQTTGETFTVVNTEGVITVNTTGTGYTYKYSEDGGLTWSTLPETSLAGKTIDIAAVKGGNSKVIANNYVVE